MRLIGARKFRFLLLARDQDANHVAVAIDRRAV
jgi:hypothetical protein